MCASAHCNVIIYGLYTSDEKTHFTSMYLFKCVVVSIIFVDEVFLILLTSEFAALCCLIYFGETIY